MAIRRRSNGRTPLISKSLLRLNLSIRSSTYKSPYQLKSKKMRGVDELTPNENIGYSVFCRFVRNSVNVMVLHAQIPTRLL